MMCHFPFCSSSSLGKVTVIYYEDVGVFMLRSTGLGQSGLELQPALRCKRAV